MNPDAKIFSGSGWELIRSRANQAQHVLIGEDHFTKEIPLLIEAIGMDSRYENFYIEVDPYTTALIQESLTKGPSERKAFQDRYSKILSFYTLKEEYALLEKLVAQGIQLLGSDQIVMYDDRLLADWLTSISQNPEARRIYNEISQKSQTHFKDFLEDPKNKPMYMLTDDFTEHIDEINELNISDIERSVIQKLEESKAIYITQNHRRRVQLLKHHLMSDYPRWKDKRNLFKYGANHMARGESFLTVTDIGNLVSNIAEAAYSQSFHLMIMGESGMQATAFETFPPSAIDPDGFYLKHLKPFFELTAGEDWAVFDLLPLREAMIKKKLSVDDLNLRRTLMGFDVLVLIPEVTPAGF